MLKKLSLKSLQNKNWQLCHEIVELRDGKFCVIPDCGKRSNLDLDHAISRKCKKTFYEIDILNFLCSAHHTHKSFRKGQWVDKLVDKITIDRIGMERFEFLTFLSRKTCPEWSMIWYQEEMNLKLREKLQQMNQQKGE